MTVQCCPSVATLRAPQTRYVEMLLICKPHGSRVVSDRLSSHIRDTFVWTITTLKGTQPQVNLIVLHCSHTLAIWVATIYSTLEALKKLKNPS